MTSFSKTSVFTMVYRPWSRPDLIVLPSISFYGEIWDTVQKHQFLHWIMLLLFPQRLRYGYPFLLSLNDKDWIVGNPLFQPPLSTGQLSSSLLYPSSSILLPRLGDKITLCQKHQFLQWIIPLLSKTSVFTPNGECYKLTFSLSFLTFASIGLP